MGNYENQRRAGSTIIKARSAKEAMADARMAFGPDVEVLAIEKVGKLYCLEVCNPGSEELAPRKFLQNHVSHSGGLTLYSKDNFVDSRATSRAIMIEDQGVNLEGVARLEKKFEELSRKFDEGRIQLVQHQGAGLSSISSIRDKLLETGFAEPLVGKLAGALIDGGAMAYDKDMCLRVLTSWLGQLGAGPQFDSGWCAIVGPAGSGKTTTIAKLASRASAQWGPDSVGLVTTDFYRIGAYEQLRMFGEMLGIKVWPARNPAELSGLKQSLSYKKVVYVDTIGTGRDDEKMREQMSLLGELGICSSMAIQANLDRNVMRADLTKWREAGVRGAVITKLDQALSLAEVVESLIIKNMPVSYAANGQRVPADLHKVSSLLLAHKALRSVTSSGEQLDSEPKNNTI